MAWSGLWQNAAGGEGGFVYETVCIRGGEGGGGGSGHGGGVDNYGKVVFKDRPQWEIGAFDRRVATPRLNSRASKIHRSRIRGITK